MSQDTLPHRSFLPSFRLASQPLGRRFCGAGFGLAALLVPAAAQNYFPTINPFTSAPSTLQLDPTQPLQPADTMLQTSGLPFRVGPAPPLPDYNIKMGSVYASVSAGVTSTYTSNYNLVSSENSDGSDSNFTIGPSLGIGLSWQPTEQARLVFNIGMSYQFSLSGNTSRLILSPSSALNYQFSAGPVQFTVFNTSSTATSATFDPVLSGSPNSSLGDFNQISNTTGLGASWQAYRDTQITASYGFGITRSLDSDVLQQLNHNSHSMNLAVFQTLSPVWTVGIQGNGSINRYQSQEVGEFVDGDPDPVFQNAQVQNNSQGWGVGPVVSWTITQFLQASAAVSYTVIDFDDDGVVTDTSNFGGMTGNISLSHTINQQLNHQISFGRNVDLGTGSNYTQYFNVNYGLNWQFSEAMPLNFGVRFVNYEQSGDGFVFVPFDPGASYPSGVFITDDGLVAIPTNEAQEGQQYTATIGTGYSITQNLRASLSYQFIMKRTDQASVPGANGNLVANGDYNQSSVTLSLGYSF